MTLSEDDLQRRDRIGQEWIAGSRNRV